MQYSTQPGKVLGVRTWDNVYVGSQHNVSLRRRHAFLAPRARAAKPAKVWGRDNHFVAFLPANGGERFGRDAFARAHYIAGPPLTVPEKNRKIEAKKAYFWRTIYNALGESRRTKVYYAGHEKATFTPTGTVEHATKEHL